MVSMRRDLTPPAVQTGRTRSYNNNSRLIPNPIYASLSVMTDKIPRRWRPSGWEMKDLFLADLLLHRKDTLQSRGPGMFDPCVSIGSPDMRACFLLPRGASRGRSITLLCACKISPLASAR